MARRIKNDILWRFIIYIYFRVAKHKIALLHE